MSKDKVKRGYTVGEEVANSITHGMGVVFSIVALTLLIVTVVLHDGDAWNIAAAIICGFSLVAEYTFSTLYHSFPWPKTKHVFKVLDHAGIYFLIAGSYTPFLLVTLRGTVAGWSIFAIVWTVAFIGIATEAFWTYRPKWVSVLVYVAMGWMAIFIIGPMAAALPSQALWLLIGGGLFYTVGTLVYIPRKPYLHAIWHLFVLAGSICHFLAVILYVL
jgi:hemolysin III